MSRVRTWCCCNVSELSCSEYSHSFWNALCLLVLYVQIYICPMFLLNVLYYINQYLSRLLCSLSSCLIVLLLCTWLALPLSRISFNFSQALTFCSPSLSATRDGFSFSEEFFNALVVSPVPGNFLFLISRCLKPLTLGSRACNKWDCCRAKGEGEVENSSQCLPWKGSPLIKNHREKSSRWWMRTSGGGRRQLKATGSYSLITLSWQGRITDT